MEQMCGLSPVKQTIHVNANKVKAIFNSAFFDMPLEIEKANNVLKPI